jgi:hypothetical protein
VSGEQHATAADPDPRDPRAFDLLVIGDCNPDVLVMGGDVTPAFDQQEKLVDSMTLVVGGSASITAIAAARLGLRVALVAAIGDDAAGNSCSPSWPGQASTRAASPCARSCRPA